MTDESRGARPRPDARRRPRLPDSAPPQPPAPRPPTRRPPRPWRTEGMPPGEEEDAPQERSPWLRRIATFVAVYLILFAVISYQDRLGDPPTITYTEFSKQVAAGNVAEVFSRGDHIEGRLDEPAPVPSDDDDEASDQDRGTYTDFETHRPSFAQDDLLTELEEQGAVVRAEPIAQERGILLNLLISFAPWLLIFGFYWWMIRRQRHALGGVGGLFGGGGKQKPVDPEEVRVTFDDVAGIDEVKAEVSEVVDYLRDPDRYRLLGARAPKGILLSGPPGTGKTLLARATAGEAGVPFFSASASEFIEMIVGVGAQRVRELFSEARRLAPSIVFIDEIDTIGRARGAQTIGGHDEREQTLNQILTEMDGFSGSEGVVVLAATNRPDILDPALTRAGRFDRTVTVNPPDQTGREAILAIHTRGMPLDPDVDLAAIAAATPGMTGADLANLANEAAFAAARDGLTVVPHRYFTMALEKVQLGAARDLVIPEDERRRTAYHEAGHALLGMVQPGADPVRKVSIIPRGRALGVTVSTPERDRYGYDEAYLRGRIIGALGGRAAELLVYGVTTTGAEQDLEMCSQLARTMVGRWGMSERIGPVSVLPREGDPRLYGVSDQALAVVDEEVRALLDACAAEALSLLEGHRSRLDALVGALLEHETLDQHEAYAAAGLTGPEPDPR